MRGGRKKDIGREGKAGGSGSRDGGSDKLQIERDQQRREAADL